MLKDKVFRLVYVQFGTKKLKEMEEYYSEILGYTVVTKEDKQVYLTNGFDHHNIILTESNNTGVLSYGFQITKNGSLKEYSEFLLEKGFENEIKTNAVSGIAELVEVKDPAGVPIHLFQSIEVTKAKYAVDGIAPLKLGHVAFLSPKVKETVAFYRDVLGFHYTDMIANGFANFLTCNYEHHVINVVDGQESKLHHIAFQLKDTSHHSNSSDFLARKNIPVLWGPNRHTAGHNVAAYHKDPDGNIVELYTDMDVFIPELGIMEPRPWHEEIPLTPRNWEGLSAWGTEFAFDLAKGE